MFNLIIALVISLTCHMPAFGNAPEDSASIPSPQGGATSEAAIETKEAAPQSSQSKADTPLSISPQQSKGPDNLSKEGQPTATTTPVEPSYDAISKKAMEAGVPSEPSEGPLLSDRRHIRQWLVSVKQRGVGIGFYMPLYEEIESGVRAKVPEQVTHAKVQSICTKIAAQVKESNRLQSWRPVKPIKDKEERPVYWIGERRDDDALKVKANNWYNNALNLVGSEEREKREVQSKLWRQRDAYLKEMRDRWGGTQWEGYGNNDNLRLDNQIEPLYRAPRKDLRNKR